MEKLELYKALHRQILDYTDDELLTKCAQWGLDTQEKTERMLRYAPESGSEDSPTFMFAVTTAVIIGEFGKRAFNDYFSDEAELDLDILDLDFSLVREFLNSDISTNRKHTLEQESVLGLQDVWEAIHEWKHDIYSTHLELYEKEGKEVDLEVFNSLVGIFDTEDDSDMPTTTFSGHDSGDQSSAYAYVCNGFVE